MYTQYFQLREMPFSITPDPAYLYMSQRHQEALGHLLFGTGQYGGFVQLTGEVGTGKTTIIRALLEQKLPDVDVAMVHNPRQGEKEFVQTLCDELGVSYAKRNVTLKTLVDALNAHLLTAHATGRRTVLIIDEAQNLQPQVLEQVRLLTNLETHKEKLLRIMLIGQPELIDLLARPDLRQLAQRITARYHLTPLSEAETREYIVHRLRVAGSQQEIFLPAALHEVHRHARGIPRLINIICDRALLGAYGVGAHQITAEMARRAAQESMDQQTAPTSHEHPLLRYLVRAEYVLAPLALILTGMLLYQVVTDRGAPAAAKPTPKAEQPLPATVIKKTPYQILQVPQPLPVVMARLIALWQPNFHAPSNENICDALAKRNLECLKSTGDWVELRQLNRPAILTLRSVDGTPRHVLLRGLTEDSATLDTVNGPQTYPLAKLTPLWSGEFLILWKREIKSPSLSSRSHGDDVLWLRKRLAHFAGKPQPDSDSPYFTASLRSDVMAFQELHGIKKTGIVGVRTMITLGDNQPGTPTLTSGAP
ncbi:MAG TPA: AAA family ATPase [Stenotrophobium sp.]|nr:AAA family ATPase [Stenotrophobium sp.]